MTVEELRESLCEEIIKTDSFAGMLAPTVLPLIDSLISAAHAEGVAEGVGDKGLQESNFRKVANLLSEANAKLAIADALRGKEHHRFTVEETP